MNLHQINDLQTNHYALDILKNGLSNIKNTEYIKNYHPDHANYSGNLFNILAGGRFSAGNGAYFVLENGGKYVASAGWNCYPFRSNTAIILARMYVSEHYRGKFTVGNLILPVAMAQASENNNCFWMTINEHNLKYKKWFDKIQKLKGAPGLYKKFTYIGEKEIYYTKQLVFEYRTI